MPASKHEVHGQFTDQGFNKNLCHHCHVVQNNNKIERLMAHLVSPKKCPDCPEDVRVRFRILLERWEKRRSQKSTYSAMVAAQKNGKGKGPEVKKRKNVDSELELLETTTDDDTTLVPTSSSSGSLAASSSYGSLGVTVTSTAKGEECNLAIADFIFSAGVPFNLVEHPKFVKLC